VAESVQLVDKNELEAWLEDKPLDWVQVLAARVALRVLPLVGNIFTEKKFDPYVRRGIFLAALRAAFISWAVREYPALDFSAARAVTHADGAASAFLGMEAPNSAIKACASALMAVTFAARATADANTTDAVAACVDAVRRAREAVNELGPVDDNIWDSISADANWLSNHKDTGNASEQAAQLGNAQLWLIDVRGDKKYRVNFPIWARRAWDVFKKADGVKEAGFNVWIRWYEARLRGHETSGFNPALKGNAAQDLDLRIATQPNKFWDGDAATVNAEINGWIEEALQQPHYNLIVTASSSGWDGAAAKVFRSRFLEHTEESVAAQFRPLTPTIISRLASLPTLFAYETGVNRAARVGKLRDIHVTKQTLDIWFDFDASMPPISPEKFVEIRDRLGITNVEHHRTHWAIKNIDLYSTLSDAGISPIELEADTNVAPPEPSSGPGPQYRPRNGKLSEVASSPAEGEATQQAGLHRLLRRDALTLAENLQRAANRYPELASAADEYSKLLDVEIAGADVTAIWSVGGSLASFAQSYREQNAIRTLAEPLEPQLDALLQSVVRQHGAFIMGFEEGLDLVRRADEFAVDTARLREIEEPGFFLLNELTDNRDLVDERTRELHRPVRDSVTEFGWASSRVGYSAYLIVRNGVRAMIKFTVGDDPNIGAILAVLAGGSALAGDPNAEFVRAALPVLQQYGAQLLAFFNHSPEMRAYVEWALRVLELDRESRE